MKISITYLVLLMTGVYGEDVTLNEVLHTPTIKHNGDEPTLVPLDNRNGWVNPEDLPPMPQCIAQQDQSTWLSTMTKCTQKRCTHHFGFICTHQQWLTELSCLSSAFSPDAIKTYFPYCGRSILAKTQLHLWISQITGRPWLIDVGDANDLQNLSPASLVKGYAAVDVIDKAPTCLTRSVSAPPAEPFQHVIASCGFTGTTQHTGNAARSWEYSGSLRSMVALDFETVGYDLVPQRIIDLIRPRIRGGHYFDKDCFCSAFTINLQREPCAGSGQLDFTKERLWIMAICGSSSLPDNWTDSLKTTQFAYIPIEDWHWPMCVADMPKHVIELTDQCASDACELDSEGYCKVKRAVDRACVCRNISYDSCGGSCHIFDNRQDYIKWLHNLCANVQDWHGLPDNWRQLATPSPTDMIPWRWTIKPSIDSEDITATETCASNEWKLGSFALVNIATFLAAFLSQRRSIHRDACGFSSHSHLEGWFFKGTFIAGLQLLANWFNVLLIQNTPGYADVPVIQVMLLWCSMPRLAWLTILLIGLPPFGAMELSAAASLLFAEIILQSLSSYYMLMTVNYGREHNLYFGGIGGAERGTLAIAMYAGALMWLFVIGLALFKLRPAMRKVNGLTGSDILDPPTWQRAEQTTSKIAEERMPPSYERRAKPTENSAHYRTDRTRGTEETLLASSERVYSTSYGTFSVNVQHHSTSRITSLYPATVIVMLLLWIAQWLFWGGFIGLSSEEFCPPQLGHLTAVWIASSLIGGSIITT
ncbi:hypothetical protein BJX76DRAFT_358750 [Aspergillus varians]